MGVAFRGSWWPPRRPGISSVPAIAAPATRAPARSPATPDLIEGAERRGEIDAATADLYRAYALSDEWRRVPDRYVGQDRGRARCSCASCGTTCGAWKPGPERQQIRSLTALDPGSRDTCSSSSASGTASVESAHFYVEYEPIG